MLKADHAIAMIVDIQELLTGGDLGLANQVAFAIVATVVVAFDVTDEKLSYTALGVYATAMAVSMTAFLLA